MKRVPRNRTWLLLSDNPEYPAILEIDPADAGVLGVGTRVVKAEP